MLPDPDPLSTNIPLCKSVFFSLYNIVYNTDSEVFILNFECHYKMFKSGKKRTNNICLIKIKKEYLSKDLDPNFQDRIRGSGSKKIRPDPQHWVKYNSTNGSHHVCDNYTVICMICICNGRQQYKENNNSFIFGTINLCLIVKI